MSNRAWMPLYIDDYIRDTDHLSAAEHGAYLLLIMKYWRDGGLPTEEGLIRRYSKLSVEQWAESRDVIAALFDADWGHGRIDAELQKASEIIEKRRAAGKSTQFKGKNPASAEHLPEQVPSTSTAPLTSNQEEKEEPNGSSKKRATRLPHDWEPDFEFAASVGLSRQQALTEAQKFREWWPAQPGQKGVKLDWSLTWRTWCRKAVTDLQRSRPNATAPPGRDFNAILDEIQGKANASQASPVIDSSYERTDWGSPSSPVQLHALPARR